MKKLVLTFALVLVMGIGTFAQVDGGGALRRSKEYRESMNSGKMNYNGGNLRTTTGTPMLPDGFGNSGDSDGSDAPLGSGIVVLLGLGAAYVMGKKRKEK